MSGSAWATYAVAIEAALDARFDCDVEDLADLLVDHSGAVAGDREGLSVALDVVAESLAKAIDEAQRIVTGLVEKAGAHIVRFRSASAMLADEQERMLSVPVVPALVGLAEVARELAVSKQRVSQLRDRPDFPDPVVELAAGPVWTRASLNRFVEQWDRRPGRPRTVAG